MPKERLQTKWNPDGQRWVAFLSMEDHHSERGTIDLVVLARAKNVNNITSLKDMQAIRAFLQNPAYFEIFNKEQQRRDRNREAVLTRKKQEAEAGFHLQYGLTLFVALSLAAIINAAVDLSFKKDQESHNATLSYSTLSRQSSSNLAVNIGVGLITVLLNYFLLRKKQHEITEAGKEHTTINELLGRLDKIKHEVEVKDSVLSKVLSKINDILGLNIDRNERKNKNFINEIIAALDLNQDDNIETWELFDRNITNLQVNNLEINSNDLRVLKNKLSNEYQDVKVALREEISTINNLPDLLNYIDVHMSTNQINYGEKILPKVFIATDIMQFLQGRHLIQIENTDVNSQASSSSSSNNNPATSLTIFNQSISNQNLPTSNAQNNQP